MRANTRHVFLTGCSILLAAVLAACGGSTAGNDSGVIPCDTDGDCPIGMFCAGGVCAVDGDDDCVFDVDCPGGQVCVDGRCVEGQPDGGSDGDDGDGDDQPSIAVEPESIDFGNGRIGETVVQQLRITNAGTADLTIFSLTMDPGSSEEFSAEPIGTLNQILEPDSTMDVVVRYSPVDGSVDLGALLISCDDPDQALVRVPLSSSYKGSSEIAVVDDLTGDMQEKALIDFGQVAVAAERHVTVYVANVGSGNAVLTVEEVRTQPISSDSFGLAVSPAVPAFLSPHPGPCSLDEDCGQGNSCIDGVCLDPAGQVINAVAVEVVFAPGQVGEVEESLVITNDEGGGSGDETTRVVILRGEGIQPALVVEPNPIDFGLLFVDQQASGPVVLRNDGGQALLIEGIALIDGAGPFSIDTGGAGPWNLDPGQQIQITASYAPVAQGSHQDVMRILSDSPDSPTLVDLLGSASPAPVIVVDPFEVDFGEVQLGQVGQMFFDIRNTGGSPLVVGQIELLGGGEFAVLQQAVPDIGPDSSARVDVTYSPVGAVGADSGLVRLTCNDPIQAEVLVSLSGIGTDPELVLEPAQIDFGPIYQGFTAGPQLVTVRNGGFGTLEVTDIRLAIGSNPDYVMQNPPALPASLTPGQSVQVELYFTPSGSGLRTAAVEVAGSDVDNPLLSVPISGSGTDCEPGTWDINEDPADGCEYECDLTNDGVEECGNALDEDCSGSPDDKDVDGDGYIDQACGGGTDCDDNNPQSHPGATEIQDAADNNCDGVVDEGLIPAGAAIVSEFMKNPTAVTYAVGEYFEVTNVWTSAINLHSFSFRDLDTDGFTVNEPQGIVIAPGESAVLCVNADSGLNGGVACDYDYDNFIIEHTGADDEIIMELAGREIDRVVYLNGPPWPDNAGNSVSLDPAAYDAADNDNGANWCATFNEPAYQLPDGDYGTPGQFNHSCAGALAVLDVVPGSGIKLGGETVTLIGAGFTGIDSVWIGALDCGSINVVLDTELTCTTPAQAPGDYDVTVDKGVNSDTLTAGYRYTGEDPAPGIDWCVLQYPASAATTVGTPTVLIFGRVYKAGVTEPAGPPAGIGAQVGYGPAGSDPRTTPGWLWLDATWNPSCPDCGNDDEFMKTLTVYVAGAYSYVYRFSEDGGYTHTFCDLEAGMLEGFSTAELGSLTVDP